MLELSKLYQQDLKNVASVDLPWENLKNKSVFIIGATGLIGTFLIDLLMMKNFRENLNLRIYAAGRNETLAKQRFIKYYDNELFSFISLDVNKPLDVNFRCDYIIHAASNTHPKAYASDPVGSIMTNLLGTYNLLEYANKYGLERFIFLSTVEIYGEAYSKDDTFSEDYCGYIDCNTVRAGYPEGKRAGEALCNAYIKKYGLNIVIPRLSRIYGPTMRMNDSKAMSQFILKGVRKEDIVLKSEGKQRFSYCYMADAGMGILYTWLKGEAGQAYNIADIGENLTLREITEYIAGLIGKSVIFQLPSESEKQGFSKVQTGIMNSEKICRIGWKPFDNIKSGVTKTIEILQENILKEYQ